MDRDVKVHQHTDGKPLPGDNDPLTHQSAAHPAHPGETLPAGAVPSAVAGPSSSSGHGPMGGYQHLSERAKSCT